MVKRRILSIKEQFAGLFIDLELDCGHTIPMTRRATINGNNIGVEYQSGEISCVYCDTKSKCTCEFYTTHIGHHTRTCPLNTLKFIQLTPEDIDEV